MFKLFFKLLKVIKNPIIGPIAVASITLPILIIFYLPSLFLDNEKNKITKEALAVVDNLKTFRTYYDTYVISKITKNTNLEINFDHENSLNTIPLPATIIHNLSKKLPNKDGVYINFVSDFPFPNRADRILDSFQKESIDYFRNNKTDYYVKEETINNQKVLRVSLPDIMVNQSCLSCHNTRADSPKKDWKIGDVRGIIEVIMPLQNQFVLTVNQTKLMIIFMMFISLAFILHYGILYFRKEKEALFQTKKLRKEVKKRTKDLEESNLLLQEYKKAVDASAIVSKTNPEGIITYVNDAFCEISGYSRDELIGKPHNIVRHPDIPKELFKKLWETIQNKKTYKSIIKSKSKNNQTYFVANTIVPILNKKNEIIEYLSLKYDITELVDAREKALQAQQTKGLFLANMSHEIRTPLNSIIGFSNILCESNLAFKDKEHAKIISKSAKSLLVLINDVLDISKIESGKLVLEEKSFSLLNLTEDVVELFSISSIEKNLKFLYTVDPNLDLSIKGDSTRLKQVISNLLSNAIKFTPQKGTISLDLRILKFDEASKRIKIKFTIKDNGIGMTKDQLALIFKPFSQADTGINRKFGGTGLGLAISWDIIKAMNSHIEVSSQYGKGSEFSFDLDFNIVKTNKDYVKDSNLKIAISSLNQDQDNLKISVKNYLHKIGTVCELKDNINAEFLFCFENSNIIEEIKIFKKQNPKSKIVFIGEKDFLSQNCLNLIDYHLGLPIYGSKIYNVINHHSKIHSNILKQSSINKKSFNANVLVAEDNTNNQKLIQILLEKLGINPTIVSNGQEVIEAYKSILYQLILMDINMPILDGISATKEIIKLQKEKDYYKVPIVALTANSVAGDKEKYLDQGMDEYISKPIVFNELIVVLNKFLKSDNKVNDIIKLDSKVDIEKISKNLGIPIKFANNLVDSFMKNILIDLEELHEYIILEKSEEISQKAQYIRNSCLNISLDFVIEDLIYIENNNENTQNLETIYMKIYKYIKENFDLIKAEKI